MFHIPSLSLKTQSLSWPPFLWVREGWRDKFLLGDILSWTHVVSLHPVERYSLHLSKSLQFLSFWGFYSLLSVFLELVVGFFFFSCLTFQGCCLLTLPGCQHPKHVLMSRMSGSEERSDNRAVPINFISSEAQKQHQQRTFSSAAVRKTCQASKAGEGRGSSAGTEGEKGVIQG